MNIYNNFQEKMNFIHIAGTNGKGSCVEIISNILTKQGYRVGKSTIGELVEKLNLPDKRAVQENLNQLDLNYVPIDNEKVNISQKHNLSGGAKPSILHKGELYNKIEQLAIAAGKAMKIVAPIPELISSTYLFL